MHRALLPHLRRSTRAFSSRAAPRLSSSGLTSTLASSPSASALTVASAFPATRVSHLGNDLRVASQQVAGDTATIGVWIDTGSRYEHAGNNGVAHFLEHMFFKGTAQRTQRDFEVEIENMGGHLNAYTSREQTVFYAKVFRKDVPKALDILADILQNAEITAERVDAERDVILREMQEVESVQQEVVFDRLHETAYRDQPLGRTILGPEENIRSLTRDDILDYVKTHYTANRMVVAAAGPMEHEEVAQLAEEKFGSVPTESPTGRQPNLEPAHFTGSDIRVRYDDMPLAHVAYAFPTAGWTDPDNVPLMLMQHLLGSWDKSVAGGQHSSSSLVSTVANENYAHSIMPFNTLYSDTGLFGVYAVAEPTQLNDLMYTVGGEMTRLCHNVDDNRLAEAQNQLAMNVLGALDGTTNLCEDIGRQMLTYGRHIHPREMLERIYSTDAIAVKEAANRFFYDQDFAMAAIGPTWELPDYNFLRRRTYWLRF